VVDHFDGDPTVLGVVEGTPGVAVEGRLGESLSRSQQDAEKTYSPARCCRPLRLVFSFQVCLLHPLSAYPSESFSGLQLMCLMYAEFKRIAIERGSGMNLNDPWVTALELLDAGNC